MALSANSNFLFGANDHRSDYNYETILNDSALHTLEENSSDSNHRVPSTQSLQALFSPKTPTTLSSYTYPQESIEKQGLSSTPPPHPPTLQFHPATSLSTLKSTPLYSSLHRIDNLCSRRLSIPKVYLEDQTPPVVLRKRSDESSTSIEIKPIISQTNDNGLIRKPIEIRVRCIFSRVGGIDTLNERYTAEFFFEASWYDEDEKIGSKYDPQLGHFNPQLVVLNNLGDSLKHEIWYSLHKTNQENIVEITEHHKIRGVFWERMELNHFPYDVQELSLSITTPLTTNDIYFIQNKQKLSGVNRIVFSDEQSWHLYEHVEFTYEEHREEYSLNFNEVHPVVVCTCHVGRKCGYYIWNAYFLIFLITSASLCTFAIPASNSHGRLQITSTLLLTSVTFRWVVNKSLPPISYLTALDVYAIASIVALCIINVFHGIISYFYYNQIYITSAQTPLTSSAMNLSLYPEHSLCRLDRYAFFIFFTLFCLYQILIILWTTWIPYKRRRAMSSKDEKIRAQIIHRTTLEPRQ